MGEDLFWAIRGGVEQALETLEEYETDIIQKWQLVANKLDKRIFLRMDLARANSSEHGKQTIQANFVSMFLGGVEEFIPLMQKSFPELGLDKKDCTETSWIGSVVFMNVGFNGSRDLEAIEVLVNRTRTRVKNFKGKSDYVSKPIPLHGLRGLWRLLYDDGIEYGQLQFAPYGGIMDEISESQTPFSHRFGYIFHIHYIATWLEEGDETAQRHMNWTRRVYKYMEPYVSKSPRAAYLNYRDLDIGVNNNGYTSYHQASIWGLKYFGSNFRRLVEVKTKVDPHNFFRNEQSIPTPSVHVTP
ncbi:Berberine/berberine-like [Vigna unguiculata]|uniref:Berberine/berberine-like n=1 Tax=Vigna unguiculata TaxID=3917 RepID=A0A4D6L658_VIGUN|nr:Berberine/berberine-like [Vigna unguiculata]